jgi:signal peptidase
MRFKALHVLFPVLLAYAILTLYKPADLMAYFLPIICWGFAALTILRVCGTENIRLWFKRQVTTTALLTAALQISALIFAGLFTSFGRSPYAFTPTAIAINTAYFSTPIIAMEISRATIIKSCPKKRIFTGIALTALLYTFISIPLVKFTTPKTPAETAKFLGSELLPTLAQSLLATYLALLGGPVASITYLGTLKAFEWLSPILPNPDWTIKALISTLIPAIGFISVSQSVTPFTLMRHGIITRQEAILRPHRTRKSSTLSWMAIAIIALILLWGSTGLLGFQPSIIASGSMRPALDVGDIAITVQTPPDKIRVGDIIQFWRRGEPAPIIHRVIQVDRAGGVTYIVTKGDANDAPDDPITVTQTLGKVVLVIPKIGWISIALKTAISTTASYIQNNFALAIALIGLAFAYSAFRIHKYRNKPLYKLKRRLGR